MPYFKLNLETNHATLAGHTMMHELDYAGHQGGLGSIDANTGDLLFGLGYRSISYRYLSDDSVHACVSRSMAG